MINFDETIGTGGEWIDRIAEICRRFTEKYPGFIANYDFVTDTYYIKVKRENWNPKYTREMVNVGAEYRYGVHELEIEMTERQVLKLMRKENE